jgi:hypothetical protein
MENFEDILECLETKFSLRLEVVIFKRSAPKKKTSGTQKSSVMIAGGGTVT